MAMLWTLPCFAGASGALLLALIVNLEKEDQGRIWSAGVHQCVGELLPGLIWLVAWHLSNEEQALFWRQVSLIGELALPIAIYHVSLSLTEQLSSAVDLSRLWRLRAMLLIAGCLGILVVGFPHLIMISLPGSYGSRVSTARRTIDLGVYFNHLSGGIV